MVLGGVAAFHLYFSFQYWSDRRKGTITRGVNGLSGTSLTLTCPTGRTIKTTQVVYVCNDVDSKRQPTCDPQLPNGDFDSSHTNSQDGMTLLQGQCDGKNSCTVTLPSDVKLCTGDNACKNVALIGTYNCVV